MFDRVKQLKCSPGWTPPEEQCLDRVHRGSLDYVVSKEAESTGLTLMRQAAIENALGWSSLFDYKLVL